MITLQNDYLRIKVVPLGAEFCSLYDRLHRREYIWPAGKAWPKHSPVLFPIVGQLKDNQYHHNGIAYTLPRHGFAREKTFTLAEQSDDRLVFRLTEDASTLLSYPFRFVFDVIYTLQKNSLTVTYRVHNPGDEELYFSVGAHPAFRVPQDIRHSYNDYYLEFEKEETSGRRALENGLVATTTTPFFNGRKLPLTKELFHHDALVFNRMQSDYVDLRTDKNPHGIRFFIHECPYLGIWAAKDADFICIEPWNGIADSINSNGNLKEKEGIQILAPLQEFTTNWGVMLI
jgi:galactose mutarotase-like enzyme